MRRGPCVWVQVCGVLKISQVCDGHMPIDQNSARSLKFLCRTISTSTSCSESYCRSLELHEPVMFAKELEITLSRTRPPEKPPRPRKTRSPPQSAKRLSAQRGHLSLQERSDCLSAASCCPPSLAEQKYMALPPLPHSLPWERVDLFLPSEGRVLVSPIQDERGKAAASLRWRGGRTCSQMFGVGEWMILT